MFFYLKASSKDNNILKKFCQFLLKLETSPSITKHFSRPNKQKFITVLKSPHVNKTAQEQFELRFYSRKFLINSLKPLTFFLTLKKIKNLSFPGLKLEIKGVINTTKKNESFLKVVNPDNIVLETLNFKSVNNFAFQKKYIQLFDCYGESYLKDLTSLHSEI